MGRTLHYELRVGEGTLAPATVMRVAMVQALYRSRFTWTCEQPDLVRTQVYPRWPNWHKDSALPADVTVQEGWRIVETLQQEGFGVETLEQAGYVFAEPYRPGAGMSGFTKVGDDEWNALVLAVFLRCVSNHVPGSSVHVSDEGNFILAGRLVAHDGSWHLDYPRVAERRDGLRKRGLTREVEALDRAVALAERRASYFADVPAEPYLGRREFKQVDFDGENPARMTLAQVAAYLDFPGWKLPPVAT